MRVEPSQIVEHRNKRRPREVSFGKRSHQEPRHVRARFDGAARARALRLCRAGTDFNFSRRHPRPCGSPHVVRPRIRDRGRDPHQCARVHLFCSGLRVRVRVLNRDSARVNKPPFRPRRAAATAETAAARLHFRRTGRSRDINVIRNASRDSSATVRRRAMNAIELERRYSAHNYAPLPVVLTRGKGAHLWDTAGRRYVDMMSAYSAASHGHGHPRILAALTAQAERLAVPSRAYYNDRLGAFLEALCTLTSLDAALPMNTGAEAVETAIKAARRWGYRVKGIARDRAEIIVANGNFHGRTTTAVSASTEPDYRDGFGPFTPGFRAVAFGDLAADGCGAGRADPGRGRHHRSAGGLAPRLAPYLRRAPRAADPRRGAVGL